MVQPIMKDEFFLQIPSKDATTEDVQVGQDLLDTVTAHKEGCVGMAANMIGVSKRIIVFLDENQYVLMYNPQIVKKSKPYSAEEGCLSLVGKRKTTRYESIKVEYHNDAFQKRIKTYKGWTAQIVQHEIDHCEGILI